MKKVYQAFCIEAGERFVTRFKSSETDKKKLLELGQEQAAEWGGECTSVREVKPLKCAKVFNRIDNKWETGLARSWEKFKATHLTSVRYDWTTMQYYDEEDASGDVWDCDLSDDENLKLAKNVVGS
jgi:hypothetical protein